MGPSDLVNIFIGFIKYLRLKGFINQSYLISKYDLYILGRFVSVVSISDLNIGLGRDSMTLSIVTMVHGVP